MRLQAVCVGFTSQQGYDFEGQPVYACTEVAYIAHPAPVDAQLPPLDSADGAQIAAAVIGCWLVGAAARYVRKAVT